jgi:uncharacterized protein YndB with AHSA1/START domain
MEKTKFSRDEKNATLTIERLFPAEPKRVWEALTKPSLLDQWWAPKPWKTETVRMDFRVGGQWLYAMNGPAGEKHFGMMEYIAIEPTRRYEAADVFCDAAGKPNESLPRQLFTNTLTAEGKQTRIVTVVKYSSLEDMKRILEMGMQEGLTMAYDQLDALLAGKTA